MIYVILLFLLFMFVVNYIAFKVVRGDKKKRFWAGLAVVLICTPIAIIGTAAGMAYIVGAEDIGRGVPALLAGLLTFLNGTLITFSSILSYSGS